MRSRFVGTMGIVAALALAGCQSGEQFGSTGGGSGGEPQGPEGGPTIYASLPLKGPEGKPNVQSEAILNAMKLAFKESGGKAGQTAVRFEPLDNSTREDGGWDAGQTILNGQQVTDNDKALMYLGDFDSGAAAVSIPIMNQAGIPQIGFSTTAPGLTKDETGADKNEPKKYNPTGDSTFVRIVPRDTLQGSVAAQLMQNQGCTQIALLNDKEVYGAQLAEVLEDEINTRGLDLISSETIDANAADYQDLADKLGEQSVDCVFYAGVPQNNAVQLFDDLAAGLSGAKLFGGDALATTAFMDSASDGIEETTAARVRLTAPKLRPEDYPPAGQKFFKDYMTEYGEEAKGPYPIYGYEAMKLALETIGQAGANPNKQTVRERLAQTQNRSSALGVYNIDKGGDTSLDDYAAYTIEEGQLTFGEQIEPLKE